MDYLSFINLCVFAPCFDDAKNVEECKSMSCPVKAVYGGQAEGQMTS